jgi:hypothetical protein
MSIDYVRRNHQVLTSNVLARDIFVDDLPDLDDSSLDRLIAEAEVTVKCLNEDHDMLPADDEARIHVRHKRNVWKTYRQQALIEKRMRNIDADELSKVARANQPHPLRPTSRSAALDRLANAERFKDEFGDMLLLWRQSNGWSGQTLEDWAKACPEILPIKVLNSVITGLELKRNSRTAPGTFQALGLANETLATECRGKIRDRTLHDRIYNARPICHDDDGEPWTAADFFAAFVGELDIPARFKVASQAEDESIPDADDTRGRFHALRKAETLTPTAAFARLMRFTPRTDGAIRARLESVLLGGEEFREDDAVAARLADRLLGSWEREIEGPDGAGRRDSSSGGDAP